MAHKIGLKSYKLSVNDLQRRLEVYILFKNNIKLRQAMSLAFDREKMKKLLQNINLAESMIPPGLNIPGF